MTFYITLCTTVWFLLETERPRLILIWHGIVFLNSWISYIYHLISLDEECFLYSEAKILNLWTWTGNFHAFCRDRNEKTHTWNLPKILNSKSSVKCNLYVRIEVPTAEQLCTNWYTIIGRRTESFNQYLHTWVVQ